MISIAKRLLPVTLILSSALACGDGTIRFGFSDDESNSNVAVSGNIEELRPPNPTRDLVAFVYVNLPATETPPFEIFSDAEAALVTDDTFRVDDIQRGNLRVFFLLDDAEPDGVIDDGDSVAELSDPGNELSGIAGSRHVTLDDVVIDFAPVGSSTPRATADEIRVTFNDSSSAGN